MKTRSYNAEIRQATAQVLDVFNNIVIDRRNKAGIQKLIRVPCVYGNRSRVLKSLENKNKTLKIPLIVMTKGSLTRDTSRVADTNNGLVFQSDATQGYNILKNRPQPMDIEFEMSIIARYEDDMDQILSNFMPMLCPDLYVVWPNPKQTGKNMKSQVVWDGSCSYEYPTDITETDPYRVIVTTSFIYKTWIFPGLADDKNEDVLIHKINYCPNLLSLENDNFGLDKWYDVPRWMTLDEYEDKILCGMIKIDRTRDNWDWLALSASDFDQGTWSDISTIVSECSGLISDTILETLPPDELQSLTFLFGGDEVVVLSNN